MKLIQLLLFIPFLFIASTAETRVGGVLTRDTRWNAEDGPFILEKDLVVPRYIRLVITPGSKIIIKFLPLQDTSIIQIDNVDKTSVSIKINGMLSCIGKRDKRITFMPETFNPDSYGWYGIVFDNAEDEGNEISSTDITGAYCAISMNSCGPSVHASTIEYNHIGILINGPGKASITNSIISYNILTGVRVNSSNPSITGSIIIGNRNNGVWGDGKSRITIEYNCFFANADGDFLDCDPELGILTKKNSRKDSTDYASNIFLDPTFSGSPADSLAAERDLDTPTDPSKVKSSLVADIIGTFKPSPVPQKESKNSSRYTLSRYSPCIDAGILSDNMKDSDGTRNDMGIFGGPEFLK